MCYPQINNYKVAEKEMGGEINSMMHPFSCCGRQIKAIVSSYIVSKKQNILKSV